MLRVMNRPSPTPVVVRDRRVLPDLLAVLVTLSVGAVAYGGLDAWFYSDHPNARYGGWFHSALVYLRFNFEGRASFWGTAPFYYFGSTLIGIGLAIASASIWVAVLVLAYLAVTLTAAIRTEEAHLTEKFGAAYPDYRAGRGATVERSFSLDRALRTNREYRAALGVLIVLAILLLKTLY